MEPDFKKKIRLIVKLMIFALIIACAGPFFLKDENGRPFMTVDKVRVAVYLKYIELKHLLKLDKIPETQKEIITQKDSPYEKRDYTEMYKYRDEKGVLHFTDIRPKTGEYEVMYMPVSKNNTVGGKIDGLIDKVFNREKKSGTGERTNTFDTENEKEQGGIITQAKEVFQKAAGQYKDAPDILESAEEVKKKVEGVYKEHEKAMGKE